jgi:hypothetical protein
MVHLLQKGIPKRWMNNGNGRFYNRRGCETRARPTWSADGSGWPDLSPGETNTIRIAADERAA